MTAPDLPSDTVDDPAAYGYRPELKRTLSSFQVFAVSFAFISVAVGIFATYDDLLANGGPVGIWTWPVAMAGQLLVALVIAQFAARIPLSGSSYQWASRLANPRIGWIFGWLTFCYLITGLTAIDNAMASQCLMPLFGMAPDETTARVITVVILLVQAVLAIASTRLVGLINSLAVGVEVAIVIVLVVGLLIAVALTGDGSVDNLTSRGVTAGSGDYWAFGGGLMATMIVGLATLVGFDSAANMAEEAKDPHRTVPRAIVGSVVAAGVLGMLFLIALTVAIGDVDTVSKSGSPVADILRAQLGAPMERILLVCVGIAFFGGGMVTMTSCARTVFAMSRDARFPGHRVLGKVNPQTQTPIGATVLPLVIGIVTMVVIPGDALLELITAGTLFPAITYGLIVVLYLAVRRRLSHTEGAFSLGRFDVPVAVAALAWTIFAVVVLVSPMSTATPIVIVVGLIAIGAAYLVSMLAFRRSVLTHEPSATAL
ncbi:amino acid permease [Williamsia herbipolensis]|uniref:amino acid permease n=1 Tax=Williamsia herbipolensis TaxID=1603258 RepID=UPI0005F8606A|nr:amino acid permease [Williamsia herbipolensis]